MLKFATHFKWSIGAFVLITIAQVALSLNSEFPGIISDASAYVLKAHYIFDQRPDLARYQYGTYFPPGYGIWLALFGTKTSSLSHAIFATCFSWILAAGAFLFLCRRMGLSDRAAAAVCALSFLNIEIILFSRSVLSEGLFSALIYATLWLLMDKKLTMEKMRIAAFLIGVSFVVRSATVAIVPVFIIVQWRSLRKVDIFSLLVISIPGLFWSVLQRFLVPETGYVTDFAAKLDLLKSEVIKNFVGYWGAWMDVWSFGPTITMFSVVTGILAAASALLIVITIARRALRWDPLALFLGCYMAMIFLWPYSDYVKRFLAPAIPGLALILYLGLRDVFRERHAPKYLLAGVLTCTTAVADGIVFTRVDAPVDKELVPFMSSNFVLRADDYDAMIYRAALLQSLAAVSREAHASAPEAGCFSAVFHDLVAVYLSEPAVMVSLRDGANPEETVKRCPYVIFTALEGVSGNIGSHYPLTLVPIQYEAIMGVFADNDPERPMAGLVRYPIEDTNQADDAANVDDSEAPQQETPPSQTPVDS